MGRGRSVAGVQLVHGWGAIHPTSGIDLEIPADAPFQGPTMVPTYGTGTWRGRRCNTSSASSEPNIIAREGGSSRW